MNYEFNTEWNLWYHHERDNWNVEGYRNIYKIKTTEDFWKLFNNWKELGGVYSKHFFIMRKGVNPLWEDKNNKNGGCWSFKVSDSQAEDLFEYLCGLLVNDKLTSYPEEVMGISICLKKNNNVVIKIWNSDSKKNSLSILNQDIIKKCGMEIIYISHVPNKS